ncbi:protein unc-13 homolog [Curcuma longa]|uniref:protein unc-13 homolog n=1 Tax=Curcuma longa TaxID=136217 RepID=UPI003D9EA75C
MGRHHSPSLSTASPSDTNADADFDAVVESPFGRICSLTRSDIREAAYELFFMSCRSSPGFGGIKSSINYYSAVEGGGGNGGGGEPGSPKIGSGMTVPNSRIKKALGLRTRRSSPMRKGMLNGVSNSPGKAKRPMTSAEIMRLQMCVPEHSDHRLRKTLMRTLVGQTSRKAETIILPLELLRQLKPSEFYDAQEYHQWQRRQLKLLEAGLLLYPSQTVDRQNPAAMRLLDIIKATENRPIDTSKNSEVMRILCNSVLALAWRNSGSGSSAETCHWVDGYPVNIHLYLALLRSIFDLREETVVLDEVDELIELMKKTWSSLGINRMIHNVCFAWAFFQQYVETGQSEPDLLGAAVTILVEVAHDAKKPNLEANYTKLLFGSLSAMYGWAEKMMLDYHEYFDKDTITNMEHVLTLVISTSKIIGEDLSSEVIFADNNPVETGANTSTKKVDYFIKSSIRNAFTKMLENGAATQNDSMIVKVDEDPSNIMIHLAIDTEDMAKLEKEVFGPVLKKWHPVPIAVAVGTIHSCFGIVLKQFLAKVSILTNEVVQVLLAAGKLEKFLVQLAVDDSEDGGGKAALRDVVPYEVDSIVGSLLKKWTEERLRRGKDCVDRAKEIENWMPVSNNEPYARSSMDLMKLAKVTFDEFFEIPVGVQDHMVQYLADGLDMLFQDYVSFVSACGTKQSYMPSLPPLTRCNQDSQFRKLWKRTANCRAGAGGRQKRRKGRANNSDHPRPCTSRGTQRLYIRLNSLHYLFANIHALDKSLTFARSGLSPSGRPRHLASSHHFELARSAAQSAICHVAEVAAYRLIFLDSRLSLYEGLYVESVGGARIRPALRTLKQNLTLLVSILTDRAQPVAMKEVMRATFEAFLMVLLAGGPERAFEREDYAAVLEDFRSLKRAFCTCGEGLVAEEVLGRESEVVEGIVALMGLPTERLIEDFSIAAFEASGLGLVGEGAGSKLPMPPTTGRWNRADPNTVLRVICHRDDDMANQFLKRTFDLAKRR